MQDFWTSLGRGFHELFRYAYPGFLFLLLVKLMGIKIPVFKIEIPGTSTQLWSLIIFALIVGFIVYNFHRFFLHEYILILLTPPKINPVGHKLKEKSRMPSKKCIGFLYLSMALFIVLHILYFGDVWPSRGVLIGVIVFHLLTIIWFVYKSNYLYYEGQFLRKRMHKVTIVKDNQTARENDFSGYMVNRWANAHAIGITCWLPILMYWYASGFPSRNGIIFEHQSIFWISIGIFLIAWAWQVISLSYIEREFWDC